MIIVEQDDKESTAAGVDKRPADEIGYKSTEMASGSKLLAEIVRELHTNKRKRRMN